MKNEILKQRIWLPNEVDEFLHDNNFRDSIAGATTVSLSHLRRGFSVDGFSMVTYGKEEYGKGFVNIDVLPEVFEKVMDKGPSDYPGLEKVVVGNRNYGFSWSVLELYTEIVPKRSRYPLSEVIFQLNFVELSQLFAASGGRSLRELIQKSDGTTGLIEGQELRDAIREFFPSFHRLYMLLRRLPARAGVQVLYGNREEFINFLRSVKEKEAIDDCAIEINQDIPPSLILGVVPLGQYEIAQLK